MNIKIDKAIIQNFLSIGNIELEFNNSGTVLIQGVVESSSASESNGAGKSTIIEAINWALFDETLKGIGKDDIVNSKIGKDCFVTIFGEIDGVSFEVTRHRKHKKEKNKVIFIYNENDISDSADLKTNKKIEEALGMNFKDFQTNIIFSSDSMKFLELGDTERKKIFDGIVKSDLYEICIDKVKAKIKEIEIQFNDLNLQREKAQTTVDDSIKRIENYTKLSESFESEKQENLKKLIIELDMQKTALAVLESTNCEEVQLQLSKQKEELISQKNSLMDNNVIDELIKEMNKTNEKLSNLKNESYSFQQRIMNNNKTYTDLNEKAQKCDNEILKYENALKTSTCPLCKHEIKNDEEIKLQIDKEKADKVEYRNSQDALQKENMQLQLELDAIVEEGKISKQTLTQTEEKINLTKETQKESTKSIDIQIENCNEELMKLNMQQSQLDIVKEKVKSAKDKYDTEFATKNVYLDLIEQDGKTGKESEEKVKLLTLEIEKLGIEKYKYWINGFKKIKGLLISTITPMMNEKAQEYSQILTNGEFDIQFITQRENKDGSLRDVFEVEVSRKDGGSNYKGLSGGEKRRVDLITIFVLDELKRLSSVHNINIRFFDEIFDSLDGVGKEKVMNLLNIVSEDKEVFVISHKDDLKDLFNKSITIVKRDGISSLLNYQIPIEKVL